MHCSHCSSFISDGESRCPECGAIIPRKGRNKRTRTADDNTVCSDGLVASIVLMVLSLLCCSCPAAPGVGIAAIVLSAVARQELNGRDQERGLRLARYARIFRIITAVLIGLQVLFFLLFPIIGEPLGMLIAHLSEWLTQTFSM